MRRWFLRYTSQDFALAQAIKAAERAVGPLPLLHRRIPTTVPSTLICRLPIVTGGMVDGERAQPQHLCVYDAVVQSTASLCCCIPRYCGRHLRPVRRPTRLPACSRSHPDRPRTQEEVRLPPRLQQRGGGGCSVLGRLCC